jgi:salicylate hydroxylase
MGPRDTAASTKLQIGVVGCGIAGLSATIALARAGHAVEVFERSRFTRENGAAMVIGANATRVLAGWGFDVNKYGAVDYCQLRRFDAKTGGLVSKEEFHGIEEKYGSRWLIFHRADLHAGLLELVQKPAMPYAIAPKINLGTAVSDADPTTGAITLADGRSFQKDVIIIADGAHSKLIPRVTGREEPIIKSPLSIYRFMHPMSSILEDPSAGRFYRDQPSGFTVFYVNQVGKPGVLLNAYPVRGEKLLYVALMHPTKPQERDIGDNWNADASYGDLVADMQEFHPSVKFICEGAEDIKVFTVMKRDPVPNLTRGRAILVGDAGHLMLSTHGQGASQSIEDAAALEVLFNIRQDSASSEDVVLERVQMFDDLRGPRIKVTQTLSNKMMGSPEAMMEECRKYYDGPLPSLKAQVFSNEYNDWFFNYDVGTEARNLLEATA